MKKRNKKLFVEWKQYKSIKRLRKHSPKTPVVASTSNNSVCRTREGRYGGKKPRVSFARAKKSLTSFPVPVAVLKTVGAKSPYLNNFHIPLFLL